MAEEIRTLVESTVTKLKEMQTKGAIAYWEMAATGSEEAARKSAELEKEMSIYASDRERFARLKAAMANPTGDALLDRQVKLLHDGFADMQLDPDIISEMIDRSTELQRLFSTFRGTIDGRAVSENEVREILVKSNDNAERKKAWEASKQIGAEVAPKLVELVKLRNKAARSMGYRNFYEMRLLLQEIEPAELFKLLGALKEQTDGPFYAMKQQLDAELAARFGVKPEELRPWHYADPFFQEVPPSGKVSADTFVAGKSLEEIATRFYADIGMDVRDILERSDLYERPGKNQHAFCMNIDREGDIRTLCNLRPTEYWLTTILHELGHAIYEKYVDPELPWLLRTAAHTNSTEAIAMYFGRLTRDPDLFIQYCGAPEAEARQAGALMQDEISRLMMIFARWGLVMMHFERGLYENPDQDLNRLWWATVGELQFIKAPEKLTGYEWATKIHIALFPVYYHNYLIGEMTASQLQATIARATGTKAIVGNEGVSRWLKEEFFKTGAVVKWDDLMVKATGEPLTPRYFVEQFVNR